MAISFLKLVQATLVGVSSLRTKSTLIANSGEREGNITPELQQVALFCVSVLS
jgi:hypothetical protein